MIKYKFGKSNKFGEYEMSKVDWKLFDLVKVKSRQGWKCLICHESIFNGFYCLGSGNTKVCIDCADKFVDNFTNSLDNIKADVRKKIDNIKSMIENIKRNNLAQSL